jgi:hypothetical protein
MGGGCRVVTLGSVIVGLSVSRGSSNKLSLKNEFSRVQKLWNTRKLVLPKWDFNKQIIVAEYKLQYSFVFP